MRRRCPSRPSLNRLRSYDGCFAQILSWQRDSMAHAALRSHRLRRLGSNHRNIDERFAWNARVVTNAANPFDTPEQVVIRKLVYRIDGIPHSQMVNRIESRHAVARPGGSGIHDLQIALIHLHLILLKQPVFANNSASDTSTPARADACNACTKRSVHHAPVGSSPLVWPRHAHRLKPTGTCAAHSKGY